MSRRMRMSLLALTALAFAAGFSVACSVTPVDFTGKTCAEAADCPADFRCDPATKTCLPEGAVASDAGTAGGTDAGSGCASDSQCGGGNFCKAGACAVCDEAAHCGASCSTCMGALPRCENGACVACREDKDCGAGSACCNRSCVKGPPALSSISPTVITAGATTGQTLELNGENFTPCSTVLFNGAQIAANVVSATRIDATIPANLLGSPGTFVVQVMNPGPGGGESNPGTASLAPALKLPAGTLPVAVGFRGPANEAIVAAQGTQSLLRVRLDTWDVGMPIALKGKPVDMLVMGDTAVLALETGKALEIVGLADGKDDLVPLEADARALDLDPATGLVIVGEAGLRYQTFDLGKRTTTPGVALTNAGCCELTGVGFAPGQGLLVLAANRGQIGLATTGQAQESVVRNATATNRGVLVDRPNNRAYVAASDGLAVIDLLRQRLSATIIGTTPGWLAVNSAGPVMATVPPGSGYSVGLYDLGATRYAGALGRGGTRGCAGREGIAIDPRRNRVFTTVSCDGTFEGFSLNVVFVVP